MSDESPRGNDKEPTVLKAVLERIVWQKDRRIIGIAKPLERREISIIGDMVEPLTGQLYEFTGRWKYNERFSKFDLHFTNYRTILPSTNQGVYHYLVRVAKWVGPETAEVLLNRYGAEALTILKTDPERVARDEIRGLTPDRVKELSETLRDNEKLEAAMLEVGQLIGGVLGQSTVEKAIKKWGADAAHIIKRDAFRLTELDGVGFVRADNIYTKIGGRPDALRRHAHAILHTLSEQAQRNGHTRVSMLRFDTELDKLVGSVHPKALPLCTRAHKVVREDGHLAAADLYQAETFIADKLTLLLTQTTKPLRTDSVGRLADELKGEQCQAFELARTQPFLILTGAPGTGKTFTVARIIALWQANGLRIALAAPTGKAAKQMERALSTTVNLPAKTIHSLLEAEVLDGEFGFQRNEHNLLPHNALVIDEMSMVDVRLMQSLLKALANECRILFVGDHYQLPSVGPGAVLRDLLAASLPSVELKTIHRNAGTIVRACHAIKDGIYPDPDPRLDLDVGHNWRHLESPTAAHTLEIIERLLADKLPSMGLNPKWQVQLISPTNESGELSCRVINRVAKGILNPGPYCDRLPFGIDDKIVRTKNGTAEVAGEARCSLCTGTGQGTAGVCVACVGRGHIPQSGDVRIVNGDVGLVQSVEKGFIYVDFLYPDRSVKIPRSDHHLRQAFCMTCHKMQGSETEVVILPIRKSLMGLPMVTREWVYTAFSRAKRFILTVGQLQHLPLAIKRIGNTARVTGLTERLQLCQV